MEKQPNSNWSGWTNPGMARDRSIYFSTIHTNTQNPGKNTKRTHPGSCHHTNLEDSMLVQQTAANVSGITVMTTQADGHNHELSRDNGRSVRSQHQTSRLDTQHPMVTKLFYSMTNLRPRKFKETPPWNVDSVLEHIQSWGTNWAMDMALLTQKLAMLFALASGARCNEISSLTTNSMYHMRDGIRFRLSKHKKNRKSSVYPGVLDIPIVLENPDMCPIKCLDIYLVRTAGFRLHDSEDPVFRALTPPHGGITTSTFGRWLTTCIMAAGFDILQSGPRC